MSTETELGAVNLRIVPKEGLFRIKILLHNHNGLYYSTSNLFIPKSAPIHNVCYFDGVDENEGLKLASYREDSLDNKEDVLAAKPPKSDTSIPKKGPRLPIALTAHQKQLEVGLWLAQL